MDSIIEPSEDPLVNPPNQLRIIIPFLPPTSNHIYVTDWKRRKRFKSSKATAFEKKFQDFVVPKYLPWLTKLTNPDSDSHIVYEVNVYFFFDKYDILTKGWNDPKKSSKKPYKKMDVENRAKLLIDCLSKATGIDDLHFFGSGQKKFIAEAFSMSPQAHIYLTKLDPKFFGVEV